MSNSSRQKCALNFILRLSGESCILHVRRLMYPSVLLKQPTYPAVLAPAFILQMGVLTLITSQTKQDLEATTGLGVQYFNQLIGSVFLLGQTKIPDFFHPHRQVVSGSVEISGYQQKLASALADTGENTTHAPGKEPNCLCACAAAALFQKNQKLS